MTDLFTCAQATSGVKQNLIGESKGCCEGGSEGGRDEGWRDEGWRDGGMEGGMEGWRDGGMEGWRDGMDKKLEGGEKRYVLI